MKHRKQVFNCSHQLQLTQGYLSGIEYNNGTIEAIYNSVREAVCKGATWRYEFNVAEH